MRIQSVDALKGLAILGILFLNIYHLSVMEVGYSPFSQPPLSDDIIELLNLYFFEGRFISLFSLLFGAGLVIQFQALKTKALDVTAIMESRLNWLLVLGILHGCFVFIGDILVTYALCALYLRRYLSDSAVQLFKRSSQYLLIGTVLSIAFAFIPDDTPLRDSEEFMTFYHTLHSSYLEQLVMQSIYTGLAALMVPILSLWCIGGIMLLGMALYKSQFFKTGLSTRVLVMLLCVMLAVSTIDSWLRSQGLIGNTLSIFSGLAGALIYAHCVIQVFHRGSSLCNVFIPVGKLSLTLYFTQSVFFALVFRVWWPDLALEYSRLDYLYWVVGFSLLQIVFANAYFRFFNQGPAEWLWRKLYAKH